MSVRNTYVYLVFIDGDKVAKRSAEAAELYN